MKGQTHIDLALLRRRFAPLLSAWQRQAQRIDALSLRERAILFVSIAAVLALLFDSLVLTPLATRQKLRADAQAQQAAEVTQLREQYVAASRNNDDPGGQLRSQLDTARAERARLDEALREAGSAGVGEGLSVVLQRLLAQQPGLVLEKLTLLEDAASATPAAPAAPRPALPVLPGIGWQGVELQVQGGWYDMQRYLQALERELPGLRWGELRLNAGAGNEPPRVQAQLFMLKVHP
ncbi:hypothetical protein [Roseateles asaccharophilus]|uniref:MSHA biogenesis protein MshJ n=1 Tax=Roseateles asaccharophilus TaxID=582607 RepID=A0ABU2A5M2_9BURK|nr:hypothetical protein [Roseateles asaccharophilus]MDR7332497.1 MSHA biogenesis protein MshJ [Roseateles asaccharophilus]